MAVHNSRGAAEVLGTPAEKVDESLWGAPVYHSTDEFRGTLAQNDNIRMMRLPRGARIMLIVAYSNLLINVDVGDATEGDGIRKFWSNVRANPYAERATSGIDDKVEGDGWVYVRARSAVTGVVFQLTVFWSPGAA